MRYTTTLVAAILLLSMSSVQGQEIHPYGQHFRPAFTVPWTVVKAGAAQASAPLVLYWFPSSTDEMQSEEMQHSQMLTRFAGQCVAMDLVRPDDWPTIIRWNVTGKLPVALLIDGDKVVARADADHGVLKASVIENMIHHELYLRSLALDEVLAAADKKVSSGDRDGAMRAYQRVLEQRCLAPDEGRVAERAIHALEVLGPTQAAAGRR